MTKHFEKRNLFTFYVREKYKPIWEEFVTLIEKDDNIKKYRAKNKSGLISIALLQVIYRYVMEKNPNFKLGGLNEISD